MVGLYYLPPTEEDTATVVGETMPCLSGSAERLIEPLILKVHSPPFEQQLASTKKLTSNLTGKSLPIPRWAWMVFVIDRKGSVFLVRWHESSCFEHWADAIKERDIRFELSVMEYAKQHFGFTQQRQTLDSKGLHAYMERYHAMLNERESKLLAQKMQQTRVIHDTGNSTYPSKPPTGKFHPFKNRR